MSGEHDCEEGRISYCCQGKDPNLHCVACIHLKEVSGGFKPRSIES